MCSPPINLRPPPKQYDLMGNLVGNGYMWVPIHIADHIPRLQATREAAAETEIPNCFRSLG